MLLFQLGVLPLEHLELRNLPSRTRRRRFRGSSSQPTLLRILPPLREHERMDLKRGSDGLHLNPGLVTQANGGELKLVGVASDFPGPSSWHNTSSLLGESVHESGASSLVRFSVR